MRRRHLGALIAVVIVACLPGIVLGQQGKAEFTITDARMVAKDTAEVEIMWEYQAQQGYSGKGVIFSWNSKVPEYNSGGAQSHFGKKITTIDMADGTGTEVLTIKGVKPGQQININAVWPNGTHKHQWGVGTSGRQATPGNLLTLPSDVQGRQRNVPRKAKDKTPVKTTTKTKARGANNPLAQLGHGLAGNKRMNRRSTVQRSSNKRLGRPAHLRGRSGISRVHQVRGAKVSRASQRRVPYGRLLRRK